MLRRQTAQPGVRHDFRCCLPAHDLTRAVSGEGGERRRWSETVSVRCATSCLCARPELTEPVDDEGDGVYTMAVASRLTGMHPQTLRKYERAGLLTPSRQQGNQRQYSAADIRRLQRIRYLVEVRCVNIAGLELALAPANAGRPVLNGR